MKITFYQGAQSQAKEVLISNAFFFLYNKDRILSDPKMYLAVSGIYHPFFPSDIVLGAVLDWWSKTVFVDNGQRVLIHSMVGSPLTGSNSCVGVDMNGDNHFKLFINGWIGAYRTLTRHSRELLESESNQEVSPYTLSEVVDILRQCPHSIESLKSFALESELAVKSHEYCELENSYKLLQSKYSTLEDLFIQRTMEYNKDAFLAFNKDYLHKANELSERRIKRTKRKKEFQAKLASNGIGHKEFDLEMKKLKQEKEQDSNDLKQMSANFLSKYFSDKLCEKYLAGLNNQDLKILSI